MRHIKPNAEWASRQPFIGEIPISGDVWVEYEVGGKKLIYNKTMVDREITYQKSKL